VTEISAGLVKELRELTGAGMMDCKRALQETEGDIDAARTLLREKGMASAGKRADRATTEGVVDTLVEGGVGTIVGLGCETEPVSKNEEFRAFADRVLHAVHISFAAPEWATRDDVPPETVEAERQVYLNSDEVLSKPEAAREKIVDGMLGKRFFAAAPGGVLLDQAWIHDQSQTVGKALEAAGARLKGFKRVSVAGS
jgi:elongation factor Ts